MAVATSTALLIAGGAALVGAGAQVAQGIQAQKQQKRSLRAQEAAQAQAKQNALSQQIRGELAQNAMNRKQPDITSLLSFEQGLQGVANGGASQLDRSKLKLGKPALLGDL